MSLRSPTRGCNVQVKSTANFPRSSSWLLDHKSPLQSVELWLSTSVVIYRGNLMEGYDLFFTWRVGTGDLQNIVSGLEKRGRDVRFDQVLLNFLSSP